MSTCRAILTALLLLLPLSAVAEEVLTLPDALRLAMAGNRPVNIARLDVRRNEEKAGSTRSQMLPRLDAQVEQMRLLNPIEFNVEQGALGTYPGIGPIPGVNTPIATASGSNTRVTLGVSQTLTGLHKLDLAAEVQDAETEVSRQEVRTRAQDVASQVRQAYFGVLDTRAALAAARDSLAFHTEFERVVGEYVEQGVSLKADLLDVRSGVARDTQTVLTLENALLSQKEQLNLLLGRDLDTAFEVAEAPAPEEVAGTPEELLREAWDRRPEIVQARVRVEQAGAARELQRADYVPDIGARLSYDRQTNSGLLPPELYLLTLQAQYDLYDGGQRDHEIAEKDLAVQQALAGLEEARARVDLELRAQLRKLRELAAQAEAARIARQSAEEKLRVTLNRHQHRAALTRDVLEAQAGLTGARREYGKILLDQASARADLDRILGRDPLP